MSNHISGFCLLKAAVLRVYLCLLFASLAAALHAAQFMEVMLSPGLNMNLRQPSQTEQRHGYLNNQEHALSPSVDVTPFLSESGEMRPVVNTPGESLLASNARRQIPNGNILSLFKAQLSFDTKNEHLEILPRRQSLTIEWRKSF